MKRLRITVEGKTYEVEVEVLEDQKKIAKAKKVVLEQASSFGKSREQSKKIVEKTTVNTVNSPLAGNVVEIKVSEGDEIKENQLVIVIEAMKMNTNIYSHRAGKIKKILCSSGEKVSYNQVLIEFE
jgi:biotin carboxyl carrier protein